MAINKKTIFFKSFVMSLTVLLVPLGASLFVLGNDAQGSGYYQEQVHIGENINAIIGVKNEEKLVNSIIMVKFNPNANQVNFSMLSPKIMVEDGGMFTTLGGVWENFGGSRARESLEKALNIKIDFYIGVTSTEFIEAVGHLGAVDYTIDRPIMSQDKIQITTAGRQLLDSRQIWALLDDKWNSVDRIRTVAQMLTELITQQGSQITQNTCRKIFNTLANNLDNNLTITTYTQLENDWNATVPLMVNNVVMLGDYDTEDRYFMLSSKGVQDIIEAFNK